MEGLSFENIMSQEDLLDLFVDENLKGDNDDAGDDPAEDKKDNESVEINPDSLFEEESESVDSEDQSSEGGDESLLDDEVEEDTSPNTNFYSSIATALKDEGILPDLDDDSLKSIKSAEDFSEAIEKLILLRMDERQRRVDEALSYGVLSSDIQRYEGAISYLDSITDEIISDESEKGETLRSQIIMQDYLNKGFSKERAEKETKKSFSAGTDLEDAKEALESNKEYFSNEYKALVEEAKSEEKKILELQKKQKEYLRRSILDSKEVFDGITMDKLTRQKVWDNLTKPVYKDDKGNYYSAIQKYEIENKADFMKKLGVIFTLTDGFKDIDKLVSQKVKKEKKSSIRELENTLRSVSGSHGGALEFLGGSGSDLESNISLTLDV